jgi:hypothetical protein
MKRIWEENPVFYEKHVARMEGIFDDMDEVLKQELKMRNHVKELIFHYNATIYGKSVRDDIQNKLPSVYQVEFDSEYMLEEFMNDLRSDYDVHILSEEVKSLDLPLTLVEDEFRQMKIVLRYYVYLDQESELYHPIALTLEIVSFTDQTVFRKESMLTIDRMILDVDELIQTNPQQGLSKWTTKSKLYKTNKEMEKQIRRKECKVYCRYDSFLEDPESTRQECIWRENIQVKKIIQQMKDDGWTILNQPCKLNPTCMFAPEHE